MPDVILQTRELADSIQKLLTQAGEADEKTIADVQRLRDEQAAPETRKMYDQAIEALKKSQQQKATPLLRKIAEALVEFAAEHRIPLAIADKPVRRRRRQVKKKQMPAH